MAYAFQKNESLQEALRRIGCEQFDTALQALGVERPPGAPLAPEAIHEARKALKKTRALLRLFRAALGEALFCREAGACRDLGRLLSGARDADVRLATLEKLAAADPAALGPIQKRLQSQARRSRHGALNQRKLGAVLRALKAARARHAALEIPADRWKTLRAGLERSLRRTRKSFCRALAARDLDALHDCRKRFKDLHFQLSLLRGLRESCLKDLAKMTKIMGEILGEDRDLAMLGEHLGGPDFSPKEGAPALHPPLGKIARRRAHLQARMRRVGQTMVDLKAGAFVKAAGCAWKAWRKRRPHHDGA